MKIDKIYTWSCDNVNSRSYYVDKQKAINAVIKRFKCPMTFGIPEYVSTKNSSLLELIKEKLEYARTERCQKCADNGVYNDQKCLEFVKELRGLLA